MRSTSICLLLCAVITSHAAAQNPTYLDQGWDEQQREEFYFTAQGSQLIPYQWFLSLEQADSTELFRRAANMQRFGFLPSEPSELNPDGLPIGFVRDGFDPVAFRRLDAQQKKLVRASTQFFIKEAFLGAQYDQKFYPQEQEAWFGLTCAACHTHEIEFDGKVIRIDGGAAQSDIETMTQELARALDATHQDSVKLARFAKAVGRNESDLRQFEQEVKQIADAVNRMVERNSAKHPYGYARLDAFGAILNEVCETALEEPRNRREANAPVSYPTLWNTPQMGYVQWNASADWAEARNVGEVLGVYGTYTLAPGDKQFESTVRLKNLIKLEHELLADLDAPAWPEDVLGKLDRAKIRAGKKLFRKNCQSCHRVRDHNGEFALNDAGRIPIRSNTLQEVRTDPQFLKNLASTALTGDLAPMFDGKPEVPRAVMLGSVVRGIMAQRARAEGVDLLALRPGSQDPPHPSGAGRGYISRPLEGIWASPPYFHNGSVPNLYETLLPAAERSKSFWVGNRKFDAKKVGFLDQQSSRGSQFRVLEDDGTPIPGNLNVGHEGHGSSEFEGFTQTFEDGAWRDFTEDERYALIEYMKCLSSKRRDSFEVIPEGEEERIANIVDLTAQQLRLRYSEDKRMLRGVHPKDHGCVTAKFEVLPTLPAELAVGVFQPGTTYDAYIRFSNAAVRVGPDSGRAPNGNPVHGSRGMAVKLLGVEGESLLPLHGALTQDFLMVNQPAFAFANVEDYELLSQVLVDNDDDGKNFFVERFTKGTPIQKGRALRTQQIVQRIAADKVDGDKGAFAPPPASPVDNPYFSAAPFQFGPGRVMKFRASPLNPSSDPPNVDDPNYLRTALIRRLKTETVQFDFAIQVRGDCELDLESDIENASTEWNDDYITVARITIAPQEFDSPEQRVRCEHLFFTPWHGITDHLPLGGINRLRKAVYLASAQMRSLPKEPGSYKD